MATNVNTRADTPLMTPSDQAIHDAYAARRREFEENYHVAMTREQEDSYFDQLHAHEAVILKTTAATIEGVLAKLRVAFLHQEPSAWSDRAITDPSHPDFVAGLSTADIGDRLAWSAIEDLARLSGVDLAEQGLATVEPPTPLESLRLEYLALHDASVKIASAEDEPEFAVLQAKMSEIEEEMTTRPSRSASDAKVKVRFMLDTDAIGVPLDGGEAHILIKDAARFLLGHAPAPTMPAASAAEWAEAVREYDRVRATPDQAEYPDDQHPYTVTLDRLLQMPAPHGEALAWKINYLFQPGEDGFTDSYAYSFVKPTLADAVRLAGGTPMGPLA